MEGEKARGEMGAVDLQKQVAELRVMLDRARQRNAILVRVLLLSGAVDKVKLDAANDVVEELLRR